MLRPMPASGATLTPVRPLTLAAILILAAFAPLHASEPTHPSSLLRLAGGYEAYGPEQRAEELYLDGLEKLEAGRAAFAQQTFESLVARFPDSAAATLARGQLAELYRASARVATGAQGAEDAAPAKPAAPAAPVAAAASPAPDLDDAIRQSAPIQAGLRTEAGDRVFFSLGSAELGGRAREALSAQAQWLNRWPEVAVVVEGHADEPGTEEDNRLLSERRAEAVRQRLVEEGVAPARLAIRALGRTQRIAECDEPECRAQNRRAVTMVFVSAVPERLGRSAPAQDTPLAQAQPPSGLSAKR